VHQEKAREELRMGLDGADGGAAHRWPAISGHGKARGGAHEVREGKEVLTRVKGRTKVERRGGAHGSGALR